jgi:hypothetical protein
MDGFRVSLRCSSSLNLILANHIYLKRIFLSQCVGCPYPGVGFISWVGGKKALRDLIYQRMPKKFGRYIEVFGGGGWVLFGRAPDAAMEVYNDLIPTWQIFSAVSATAPLLCSKN